MMNLLVNSAVVGFMLLSVFASGSPAATGAVSELGPLQELASGLNTPTTKFAVPAVNDLATVLREPQSNEPPRDQVTRADDGSVVERTAMLTSRYRDVCDDATADLHDMDVTYSTDHDGFGFTFHTCPSSPANFSDMMMIWWVDLPHGVDFEYAVALYFDGAGSYRASVTDVRDTDASQWEQVYEGAAVWDRPSELNGAHFGIGAVPAWTLEYPTEFLFDTQLLAADGRTDELPEVGENYLVWPYSCDVSISRQAEVRTEPGRTDEVAAALRDIGLSVSAVAPNVGSMLVSPINDEQMALLDHVHGVTNTARPTLLERTAVNDPEPTAWALQQISADAGWQRRDSADVRVAVVDDGVDATRTDLAGRTLAGRDAVWGYPLTAGINSDRGAHGTSVAGVIGGTRDNGIDIAGINPSAKMVPYRVIDAAGCIFNTSLAAALDDIASHSTADVVNVSLSTPGDSPSVRDAVTRVLAAGIPIVAASGNHATSEPMYPAAYPGVIAVGATDASGQVADFSNRGNHVDIVAPGGTSPDGGRSANIATLGDFDTIDYMSGTSFSAPYVAGAVSLLLGIAPELSPRQVADRLARSATDLGPVGRDDASGYGLLDLDQLLASSGTTAHPTPSPTPSPSPSPSPSTASGGFDGDYATTERLPTAAVFRAAAAVSSQRFGDGRRARHVVLARHDEFADALAGAALTGDGPLLFSFRDRVPDFILDEIDRVMPRGGRVYLLGGTAALSTEVVDALRARGHSPTRLHGPSRIETASAVAAEVVTLYGEPSQVLLARAYGPNGNPTAAWADAISAGSYAAYAGVPLLLSGTDQLHPASKAWLDARPSARPILLGGTAALSARVETQIGGNPRRVAGRDRADTAVRVANDLWRQPFGGERRYVVFNGYHPSGWAFGLATAGLGADASAPTLVTHSEQSPEITLERVAGCHTHQVDLYLAGNETLIPAARQAELDARDANDC